MVDIPREGIKEKRRKRQIIFGILGAIALGAAWMAVASLEPAARSVDGSTLWFGDVERGEMLREVRGPGTLVPREIRWIGALTEGRVERIINRPGAVLTSGDLILELTNPAVERAAQDAEWSLRAAQADYEELKVRLQSDVLAQEASVAGVEADMRSAELEAEANQELSQDGLVSDVELRRSQILAEQLRERFRIEQERLSNTRNSMPSQLGAQEARLGQAQALFELRQQELEALRVRSAIDGILQEVPVEEGEQVTPGANLARVARPGELKAELRIAETQAKDLTIGQVARIDTRNGVIDGKVERIDPAAQEGTVTVDVELLGELPRGARPQLSVDGTVEIERLDDVIYISRPAYGQAFSTIGLFKLTSENIAQRVTVELGRSSVTTFEVVRGLDEGDRVILSDTSQYDDEDRLKLN